MLIIRPRRAAVCSKAYSRSGFAWRARDAQPRGCRAGASRCGSTHRGGRCFSIIASSWQLASLRGQSISDVNSEPGAALEHGERSRRADLARQCRASTYASACASARWHRAGRPSTASSNSFGIVRAGAARAFVFLGMPGFARMHSRSRSARPRRPLPVTRRGPADDGNGPASTRPTGCRPRSQCAHPPRAGQPCCTAKGKRRHDRFQAPPWRLAATRSARAASVLPGSGTRKRDA